LIGLERPRWKCLFSGSSINQGIWQAELSNGDNSALYIIVTSRYMLEYLVGERKLRAHTKAESANWQVAI
jgi:hypothetical protein